MQTPIGCLSCRLISFQVLVLSLCKTISTYEEPRSSSNKYTNSLVVKINNLCFVLTFSITLKCFKCDTSTLIYTNTFNQYRFVWSGCQKYSLILFLCVYSRCVSQLLIILRSCPTFQLFIISFKLAQSLKRFFTILSLS